MSICIKLHLLNLTMAALSTAHRLHCRIHRGSRIAQPILDEIRGTAGCPSGKKVCWYLQLSEQQDGRQHRPSAEENSPAATCPDILFALTLSPESKVHLSDKHGDSGGEGCRNSQWRDCRNKPRLWKSSPQWTATRHKRPLGKGRKCPFRWLYFHKALAASCPLPFYQCLSLTRCRKHTGLKQPTNGLDTQL